MIKFKQISIALIAVMLLNQAVFATGARFVDNKDEEKPKESIFSIFKKSAHPTQGEDEEEESSGVELTANAGQLNVIKNTPTTGDLSYTFNEVIDVVFAIAIDPTKGEVTIDDPATGAFTYTPDTDAIGDDSFTFSVTNTEYGTKIAVISVLIEEEPEPTPTPEPTSPPNISGIQYEDMKTHWGRVSAETLADDDIIRGVRISNKYYFYPDTELTRGDFILYLTAALDIGADQPDKEAPFADKADIPAWMLKQVTAAYDAEIIKGVSEGDKIYLRPYDKLTRIEAIEILNNALKPDTKSTKEIEFSDKHLIPEWSVDAVKNMTEYGLLKGYDDKSLRPHVRITRAMSAEFIKQMVDYKDNNQSMMMNINAALNNNMFF